MYSHSPAHKLLKMSLLAFCAGLLGIVVGLLLGVVISLIGYVLMSLSPDVGMDQGIENLYMLSTSLAMKGMISGAAIGEGCGCCTSGNCGEGCQCCDEHGNCMPADKMGGCCREEMPMKEEKSSK